MYQQKKRSAGGVYDLTQIFPLPVRIAPEPWEDLASFLARAAAAMDYKNAQWLLHPEEVPHRIPVHSVSILSEKADYQFLERLLQVDEEKLYHLTLHRFAPSLQLPDESAEKKTGEIQRPLLTRGTIRGWMNSFDTTRVCPRCLAEEKPYGRLYWNMVPVVACLQHNIFLVDQCPACHRPIPLVRSDLARCPRCKKGDYREAPTVMISNNALLCASQQLLLDRLGVKEGQLENTSSAMAALPLLSLVPWQYFRLLDAFRYALIPFFPEHPFLRMPPELRTTLKRPEHTSSGLSLHEWSVLLTTFHGIFTSWPDHFFAFLDALPSVSQRAEDKGIRTDFGSFYGQWLYKKLGDAAFSFLREAFTQYLATRYTGGRLSGHLFAFDAKAMQEHSYVTKRQALKILGIGRTTLNTLIEQGAIGVTRKQGGRKQTQEFLFLEATDVEQLSEKRIGKRLLKHSHPRPWKGLLPLKTVALSWLGITCKNVHALTEASFLTAARGPTIDHYPKWLYKEAEIQQFIAPWLQQAEKAPSPLPECVPLAKVAVIIRLPLAEVLTTIRRGHLHPIDTGWEKPLFQRLVLTRNDLNHFLDQEKQKRYKDLALLSLQEAAALLDVGWCVLRRWVSCGLLPGERMIIDSRQASLLIRREALDTFRQKYMVPKEAADLLGISEKTVYAYSMKGKLHRVDRQKQGTPLFLREEVAAMLSLIHSTSSESG
jgi:hypothetical protein